MGLCVDDAIRLNGLNNVSQFEMYLGMSQSWSPLLDLNGQKTVKNKKCDWMHRNEDIVQKPDISVEKKKNSLKVLFFIDFLQYSIF